MIGVASGNISKKTDVVKNCTSVLIMVENNHMQRDLTLIFVTMQYCASDGRYKHYLTFYSTWDLFWVEAIVAERTVTRE